MKYRCPACKKIIEKKERKPQFSPFCSERCKLVDLGNWLDSGYIIISRPPDKTDNDETDRYFSKNPSDIC